MKMIPVDTSKKEALQNEEKSNARKIEIIDRFVMGEHIEKEDNIGKIKLIMRAPSVAVIDGLYTESSQAAQDGYAKAQVTASSYFIAAYVRYFKDVDYEEKYGEEFNTTAGKIKISKDLNAVLIEPLRDALSKKVAAFYEEVTAAFTDESLDFS